MKIKRKNISITIPAGLWKKVGEYADENFESKSSTIEKAVRELLERDKKQKLLERQFDGMGMVETTEPSY